jgi:hypothetical protein
MNRHRILGIALVACLATGTAACTHNPGSGMQATITLQQAGDRATSYAQAATAQLPGKPKLIGPSRTSVDCDDPTDRGPKGRVDLADDYRLDYGADLPDHTSLINHMYDYWAGLGYQTLKDTRTDNFGRVIRFQNPKDGFRFGLVEDATNTQLTLQISAPCVWPNGTPEPK